jgi:ureidoacrylate peracid hydrolase
MPGLPADLPADLVERAVYRRGRLAVFDRIVARSAALLVIDMQNAWLAPGAPFETPAARAIVPTINRLAAALRQHGGAVFWVQHRTGRPGEPDYWAHYFENYVAADKRAAAAAALVPGHPHQALYPELDVRPEDGLLAKLRFSLFARNPADPEAVLRARGIDTVIVTGTATNMCCESTVRDAMMRDFNTFMPFDAVAAPREDAHLAGLRSVMQGFADVRGVDDIIAIME